ncbi:MAG TPA: Calx-beta domain-containing protein, partial [Pyrinomonadaceae bacterium]
QGVGTGRFISGVEPLRYAVFFENKPEATAPAQTVVVTDQLDASRFDFETFSLGPIFFGKDKLITPPTGLSEYTVEVDLRPQQNLIARVEAKLDKATGLLTWRFTSIDPMTGLLTDDPLAGFLPPNKNAPEGEGQVLFTVQPRKGMPTGTQVRNTARIVFDTNAPIDTPEWLNTIDISPPQSQVVALSAEQNSSRFAVSWSGTDAGAGVASYSVFVSENGGAFLEWLHDTTAQSGIYTGHPGQTYAFYSVARDATGNVEDAPSSGDATTAVQTLSLSFDASSYSADENQGHATINVLRAGNLDATTVDYATASGTATPASDFQSSAGTLVFNQGETTRSFSVVITDDALMEGDESLNLSLSNPTGGATLVVPYSATLTIRDNDAAPTPTPTPTPSATPTPTPTPLTIQFASANYGVSEGGQSIEINVVRAGDVSGAASVDYATADGTASSKSDYTTTLGTLHFTAGEMSKTITLLITDDALVEGAETVTVTLLHPKGDATLGVVSTATLTIADDDTASLTANPLGDARFYVRQHYLDFLSRNPDPSGLNFWDGQITACLQHGSEQDRGSCLEEARINVSAAFFLSIEFQGTGYFVHRLYRASYPDSAARPRGLPRLEEFLRDTQEIGRGVVVGVDGWDVRLEANKQSFVRDWIGREEFRRQYPEEMTAAQFVETLFANAGATPTDA